jgi:hypothetical protein
MKDFDDPLDLLNDDGDGAVEICILEEEEKLIKGGASNKSGCCVVLLMLTSSLLIGAWCVRQMV